MGSCKDRIVRDLVLVLAIADLLCTGPNVRHEWKGDRLNQLMATSFLYGSARCFGTGRFPFP